MDYMDYESTLPIISKTFYQGFEFHSREEVEKAISTIPDDLPDPPGYDPDKPPVRKPLHYNDSKLSSSGVARMNKVSAVKILLLGDTTKAQAVFDLKPVKDTTKENCLFEAWLSQISNSDFIYSNDTGEQYGPLDLRYQLLYNMVISYKDFSPKVYMHLEKPYKTWCVEQLDEDCPSDLATVAALRHMFKVPVPNIFIYIPNSIQYSCKC